MSQRKAIDELPLVQRSIAFHELGKEYQMKRENWIVHDLTENPQKRSIELSDQRLTWNSFLLASNNPRIGLCC